MSADPDGWRQVMLTVYLVFVLAAVAGLTSAFVGHDAVLFGGCLALGLAAFLVQICRYRRRVRAAAGLTQRSDLNP